MAVTRLSVRPFRIECIPGPIATSTDEFVPPALPLDVEIGCGVGWHSIQYAKSHADRYLVAIERTERFWKLERRAKKNGALSNLLAVRADAVSWISWHLRSNTVSRYFLMYPNPYPKRRDFGRRWHRMPFCQHLVATLKKGGTLHLATNLSSYADDAICFYTDYWGLQLKSKRVLDKFFLEKKLARTHFEKKYLERGMPCLDLVFEKVKSSEGFVGPRYVTSN